MTNAKYPAMQQYNLNPEPLLLFTSQVIQVCYTTCYACQFGHHKSKWHTWAAADDIEHAERAGRPDPRGQQCGCYCQREGYWRKDHKRQAIEARQVARAVRGIEWAPPLLRDGKAAR